MENLPASSVTVEHLHCNAFERRTAHVYHGSLNFSCMERTAIWRIGILILDLFRFILRETGMDEQKRQKHTHQLTF